MEIEYRLIHQQNCSFIPKKKITPIALRDEQKNKKIEKTKKKLPKKPNREKKPIKYIKILKKLTGLV